MAKEPVKSKMPPDLASIKPDRVEELRRKARAAVEAEQLKASEDALYEKILKEERRSRIPEERLETLTLDFAPFTDKVTINGVEVSQATGTGAVYGDPESYFNCNTSSGVTLTQA